MLGKLREEQSWLEHGELREKEFRDRVGGEIDASSPVASKPLSVVWT